MTYPDGTNYIYADLLKIAYHLQRLTHESLTKYSLLDTANNDNDTLDIKNILTKVAKYASDDPYRMWVYHLKWWHNYWSLLLAVRSKDLSDNTNLEATPLFVFIQQLYAMSIDLVTDLIKEATADDAALTKKALFLFKQFAEALSPKNFLLTNPQILKETIDSGGINLVNGLRNLLDDLEKSKGQFLIRTSNELGFEVGQNLATSDGIVCFQNDLIQLIHYHKQADCAQHKVPIIIVPPFINKFYILDLRPDNSFVKWLLDHNHDVFIISWINPDAALADKDFEDYAKFGLIAAIDFITQVLQAEVVHAIGYCIGGTLLAMSMAYLKHTNDQRIKAATFLNSMVDFSDTGDFSVFINDKHLTLLEQYVDKLGFFDGSDMHMIFNMLRSNEMIWAFAINKYLLGKEIFPFDLLFWNADTTNIPAKLCKCYLRKLYHENALVIPGGLNFGNVPLDVSKIDSPCCIVASKADHIVPWKTAMNTAKFVKGDKMLILSNSGHIAGIINPPHKNKYGYWSCDNGCNLGTKFRSCNRYYDQALRVLVDQIHFKEGSWWNDWHKWATNYAGPLIKKEYTRNPSYRALEKAPGSYVRRKIL
jgi:polyhydroxyalkanoate synthase